MLLPMSQTQTPTASPAAEWCARIQTKMMAALDEAWSAAERSQDPAVIARARDRARLCGQFAATARKIAAMIPAPKARPGALVADLETQVAALEAGTGPGKPPAAQAVAMQAALRKLGR